MVQRAVLVVDKTPSDKKAEQIASQIADRYGDKTRTTILWYVVDTLPDWVSVSVGDQLSAHKRDAGDKATYMVIAMCNRKEAEELIDDK